MLDLPLSVLEDVPVSPDDDTWDLGQIKRQSISFNKKRDLAEHKSN